MNGLAEKVGLTREQAANHYSDDTAGPKQEAAAQADARLLARMNRRRRENARLDRLIIEREANAEAGREERWERRHWIDNGNTIVVDFELDRRRP